jgi:hypothetical protein
MAHQFTKRFGVAVSVAAVALSLSAGAAFGGEVTGKGTPLWTSGGWEDEHHTLHGASACAFSGQEDTQFEASPDYDPDAGHAQSWGQIPKVFRDFLATIGAHPGDACNPSKGGFEE